MLDPERGKALEAFIADRAGTSDRHGGDLSTEIEALHSHDWLAACLPCAHGGEGWGSEAGGTGEGFDALRTLGRANLSVTRLFEGHMNAVKLAFLYGEAGLREALAGRVRDGLLLGVWGADDPAAPLRIERDGEGRILLSGAKRFASGLGLVGEALVTAATDEGPQMVLVPADEDERSDLAPWRMRGMRASNSGRYDFTGIVVDGSRAVGRPGDYLAEPHFEGGVWRYAAAHCGAAEALWEAMVDHLVERGRASDPHQQRRIAQAAIAIETARLWLSRAACEVEAPRAPAGKAMLALLAREATEESCRAVIDCVQRALGMAAHEQGTRIERTIRDLEVFLCQAAPDAKRARVAARLVETGARPEWL